MAVQPTNANPCQLNYSNKDLTKNIAALPLPEEIFRKIMFYVCDETSRMKGAIYAVNFGRVSLLTHKMTHDENDIDELIHDEMKFEPLLCTFNFIMHEVSVINYETDEEEDLLDIRLSDRYEILLLMALEANDVDSADRMLVGLTHKLSAEHPGLYDGDDNDKIDQVEAAYYALTRPEYEKNNLRELLCIYKAVFIRTMKNCECKPGSEDYIYQGKLFSEVIGAHTEFQQNFRKFSMLDLGDTTIDVPASNGPSFQRQKNI